MAGNMPRSWRLVAAALALGGAAFVACSGGGIGGSGSPLAGGGIGGTGAPLAKGAVDRFGSVFVAGVEFDTTGATVRVNGVTASEPDLRTGMVVRVHGAAAPDGRTGTASRIAYDALLAGPVESVDASAGWIRILGRTVLMDPATTWHDTGPDLLKAGVVIEVSGHGDAAGALRASYIRFLHPLFVPGKTELLLRGTVRSLDPGAGTFRVGDQGVDCRAASLPPGGLADGLDVAVRSVDGVVGGILVASRVEAEAAEPGAEDGAWAARAGVVAAVTAGGGFVVDALPAQCGVATVFERGASGDLVVGARVAVRGVWADGLLVAQAVRFLDRNPLRLEADLEAVDAAGGTVTVLGRAFLVDGYTRLRDELAENGKPFRLADLRVKDRVALRGGGGADPLAGQIVRLGPSMTTVIEGVVECATAVSFVVGGIPVRLDIAPGRAGALGGGLDALVPPGVTVRVEGMWDGTAVVATSVIRVE